MPSVLRNGREGYVSVALLKLVWVNKVIFVIKIVYIVNNKNLLFFLYGNNKRNNKLFG